MLAAPTSTPRNPRQSARTPTAHDLFAVWAGGTPAGGWAGWAADRAEGQDSGERSDLREGQAAEPPKVQRSQCGTALRAAHYLSHHGVDPPVPSGVVAGGAIGAILQADDDPAVIGLFAARAASTR